jgi:hypothetical protein
MRDNYKGEDDVLNKLRSAPKMYINPDTSRKILEELNLANGRNKRKLIWSKAFGYIHISVPVIFLTVITSILVYNSFFSENETLSIVSMSEPIQDNTNQENKPIQDNIDYVGNIFILDKIEENRPSFNYKKGLNKISFGLTADPEVFNQIHIYAEHYPFHEEAKGLLHSSHPDVVSLFDNPEGERIHLYSTDQYRYENEHEYLSNMIVFDSEITLPEEGIWKLYFFIDEEPIRPIILKTFTTDIPNLPAPYNR